MDLSLLTPHAKDLGGGFTVRRLLPAAARQAVGPFLFFDHFGPVTAGPADDHDVRPHPHIGLATVTYLFEGATQHRDSTGVTQRIEPGAINWMTAGRGIVHSERTPDDLRGRPRSSHGLQLWAALPAGDEECAPAFEHTPAERIPQHAGGGACARVLIGAAHGLRSPVSTRSPTLAYVDYALAPGAAIALPDAEERALYGVDAPYELVGADGERCRVEPGVLAVLPAGAGLTLATEAANPQGDEFGLDRLEAVVRKYAQEPLVALAVAIETAVEVFADGTPFGDDRTIVMLRREE